MLSPGSLGQIDMHSHIVGTICVQPDILPSKITDLFRCKTAGQESCTAIQSGRVCIQVQKKVCLNFTGDRRGGHSLAQPDFSALTFTATDAPSGTTVGANTGIVSAGATAGEFDVTVVLTEKPEITTVVSVSVVSA